MALWTSRNASELRTAISARIAEEHIASPYYKMVDGTSFAAPIVSSIVAQMLSVDPTMQPSDVKTILVSTASPLPSVPSLIQGAGVVDQRAALNAVHRRNNSQHRAA